MDSDPHILDSGRITPPFIRRSLGNRQGFSDRQKWPTNGNSCGNSRGFLGDEARIVIYFIRWLNWHHDREGKSCKTHRPTYSEERLDRSS